jgi:hypothetical protein
MSGGVGGVCCMFDVFFTFSVGLFLVVFEMSSWPPKKLDICGCEFFSVDNDDVQTESGVHESTQSNSVDDVKEGDVAPPTISNSKPVNNDIKQQSFMHADCLCPIQYRI